MYQTILFDLDGTLTDPGIGITNSAAYALEKFGIQVDDRRELYKWIGPPLQDSFTQFCGFSKEDTKRAVVYYREYYKERGIYENRLYDGIEKMLKALFDAGKTLLVATSKPELFAVQILEYFRSVSILRMLRVRRWMEPARKKKMSLPVRCKPQGSVTAAAR